MHNFIILFPHVTSLDSHYDPLLIKIRKHSFSSAGVSICECGKKSCVIIKWWMSSKTRNWNFWIKMGFPFVFSPLFLPFISTILLRNFVVEMEGYTMIKIRISPKVSPLKLSLLISLYIMGFPMTTVGWKIKLLRASAVTKSKTDSKGGSIK